MNDEPRLSIAGFEEVQKIGDLIYLVPDFAMIRDVLSYPEVDLKEIPATSFFCPGEEVFKIEWDEFHNDVISSSETILPCEQDCFTVTATSRLITFVAKKHGYLVFSDKMSLESPVQSGNLFALRFRFLPLRQGRLALYEYYRAVCREHRNNYPGVPVKTIDSEKLDEVPSYLAFDEILVQGVEPREGRDAEIKFCFTVEKNLESEAGCIDYRDFHNYVTVEKGDLLAEKISCIHGREGEDIYGKTVPVTFGLDKDFMAGENVVTERNSDRLAFFADKTGILKIDEKSIAVAEVLNIPRDVDFSTGNILFNRDVIVKGSLRSGFRIENEGDLYIEGTVEAGSKIACGGNLVIKGGILGENTLIQTKGNCDIGFVQDARIHCGGNLVIQKSVINGNLFAAETLVVLGAGLKEGRSSVMGGSCRAMKEVRIKSAGTYSRETVLSSGYNPYAQAAAKTINEAVKAMEAHLAKAADKIGFDINSPESVLLLKRMSPDQKQKLKTQLLALKELTARRERQLELEKATRGEIYQKELKKINITIPGSLLPLVIIQLSGKIKNLKEKHTNVCFFLAEDEIHSRPG